MEKITVIIPMYNASQTIEQCLDSILKQTYTAFYQIIVIDDGSTDLSVEALNLYITNHLDKNFDFHIIHQENKGAAQARNVGLLSAKGNWIAFLDSDDQWFPDKIETQIKHLLANVDIDMVAGIYGEDNINAIKNMETTNLITIKEQVFKNYFSMPTVLFKSSILKKTGLFNPCMRYSEDFLFFCKMVYHGKCVLLHKKLAERIFHKKRWGESGLSGNLIKMEQGELYSLFQVYKLKYISLPVYLCATCFSLMKLIRRIIITMFRRMREYNK